MATLSIRCKYSIQTLSSVHNLQHFLFYSTKSPNQSIKSPNQSYSNYLVDNLGFSPQQAHTTSTKLRTKNGNYSKFSDNANSVVDFLKQHGFEDIHIKKVVSSHPIILACNVDKTLKPKFKVLQDHGFSGSNLVSVISTNPSFVSRNLDTTIQDLRAVLGTNENLTKLFRRPNCYITTPGLENLVSNVALLINEYGFDINVIRKSILREPLCFMRKPEFFRNVLVRVEEELGIPRISGMFLYGVHLLSCLSRECIELKCQALRSFGWTEYDVSELMRRGPIAFLRSEESIKKKLGFLMTELGYDPDFLAKHSVLFTFSLENRMLPRHRVLLILKEKGLLDYKFYTAITKTETQFLKTLIQPYKEAVPGLLQVYQNSKGCSKVEAVSR
ncbi:uncharacterized protein LOC141647340 [Silene latifolia]|uniref:uncharacterized protein LOC141647340 n=1 Tax=Silene latifolia TaxID=37657 RepID=UPI003D772C58